jgi:peptidoglycan/LPS O-acetylase OafA/YrhL
MSAQVQSPTIEGGTADFREAPLANALASQRIRGLDFMRAVAVLLVLADHSGLYRLGPLAVFDGGFGVEIFFVLSGFLITKLLCDEVDRTGSISFRAFYWRRAARLLPAFYLYLLGGAAMLLLMHRDLPWGAIATASFYTINYYQAFTGAEPHYLSHCWSLAVEEQFYLLWPLLLAFVLRKKLGLIGALATAIVFLWLLRLLFVVLGASDEYLYRALETRADQLAVGCLLAALMRDAQWRGRIEAFVGMGWIVPVAILAAILFSLTLHGTLFGKYVIAYSLEPVLVALMIPVAIISANGAGASARMLNDPVAVMIGRVSYGVYLFHPWVIHPIRHLIERATGLTYFSILVSIVVLIGVAYASFVCFEAPIQHAMLGKRSRGKSKVLH